MNFSIDAQTILQYIVFFIGIAGVYAAITSRLSKIENDVSWIKDILNKKYAKEDIS